MSTHNHISNDVRCHVRTLYRGRYIRCWRRAHETRPLTPSAAAHLVCPMHIDQLNEGATLLPVRHLASPPKFMLPEPTPSV